MCYKNGQIYLLLTVFLGKGNFFKKSLKKLKCCSDNLIKEMFDKKNKVI
jgi:hypothetical protein